ncbi:MAG: DEAD/DEAH box helicase [bacterium]|nr:DEAD/DEAH box helicase [bacterium]
MPNFTNYEFHRLGVGLVPERGHGQEGSAIFIEQPGNSRPLRSCTCEESKRKTCTHLKTLARGVTRVRDAYAQTSWEESFSGTVWFRLAHQLFDGLALPCAEIRVAEVDTEEGSFIRVATSQGQEVARYFDAGPARLRFLERTGKAQDNGDFSDRAGLLDRLHLFQASPEERQLNKHGVKTNRQTWEESFWYRLAYHCTREFGDRVGQASGETFYPAVNQTNGDFTLTFRRSEEEPLVKVVVPRLRVQAVLRLLRESFPGQEDLAIYPLPLQTLFRVTQETELDLLVRPVIRVLQMKGQQRFYSGEDLEKFRYGNLVYVRELRVLAELEQEGQHRKFRTPKLLRLKRSQVPSFLDEHAEEIADGTMILDEPLRGLEIFKEYDFVEISAETLERSWYWLAVKYGFGDQTISFEDMLSARGKGLPYLETARGWIDLNSSFFEELDRLEKSTRKSKGGKKGLRLSASELLRFQAAAEKPIRVEGQKRRASVVQRLLDLSPSTAYETTEGLISELRHYQHTGTDWLRFLYENRLGGLLCDDMGLGKTHQAMALMISLREQDGLDGTFLVVCPTSVISHWRNKIRQYAPGLEGFVYHGPERDFAEALRIGDVILTSYGILRNDELEFSEVHFALAIFDEIQHIKNRDTRGYEAAVRLSADVKIGLTGTPIENAIEELKALFDLVLPGYLGSDEAFADRYSRNPQAEEGEENPRLHELRRTISPFVLRRLKASVLDELPEKIEDDRTCELSPEQVKLYRAAISDRGAPLVDQIKAAEKPLPYIHIFALLNYLKQICDHPALALKEPEEVRKYRSGKWDLYREILQECLDSGLKVVVFTQYLGMIEMMERHLRELEVEHVKLTGASVQRGDIIDRFNEDDDCRVFLGSLKAGGTGIDLVGGSVVIHYDRWWNAAREDQATDRVHRIGQKRAVQVFKLITEGTLEEKIDAIIARKRELMESVVQEDDPTLAKIFSRDELLGLLRQI